MAKLYAGTGTDVKAEAAVRFQLSQLAYEVFTKYLEGVGLDPLYSFKELSEDMKAAWSAAIFAAIEAAGSKGKLSARVETVTTKQRDNGYFLFAGVRALMKEHPSLYTYEKFSEEVKEGYRELAMRIYYKIDSDLESDICEEEE